MSVYSKSMIERKGSGKTTIVERKWTLLALYCIAAAPSCPMLFAFCTKGPTLFAARRGDARAIFALLQIVWQQFGSPTLCGVMTLSGRLCSTVRRSDAVRPSPAPLRSGPTPFGPPGITRYTYMNAEDPTMFRVAFCSTRPTLLDHCCSTAKRISCCSDNAQQRRTIAP